MRALLRLFGVTLGLALATGIAFAKPVELRLVVWEGDEALRVLREVTKDFERANPNIKVKLENVDYRYYFQRFSPR